MQKCLFDWHNKLCAFYMRPQAKQWQHWWVEGLVGVKACVFWVGVVFESRRTYLFHFMPTGHVNNSSLLFHCYFHLATHSEMLVQDFLAPCHYLVVHSLYLLLLLLLLRQQRRHSRITHLIWQTTWCARIVITIHTNDERKCRRQHSRTSTQYVLGDENRKNRCQCQRENRKPYFHWWNKSLFSVLRMFSSQPFTLFNFSCCLRREYALTLFAAFFPQMLSAVNKKKKKLTIRIVWCDAGKKSNYFFCHSAVVAMLDFEKLWRWRAHHCRSLFTSIVWEFLFFLPHLIELIWDASMRKVIRYKISDHG